MDKVNCPNAFSSNGNSSGGQIVAQAPTDGRWSRYLLQDQETAAQIVWAKAGRRLYPRQKQSADGETITVG